MIIFHRLSYLLQRFLLLCSFKVKNKISEDSGDHNVLCRRDSSKGAAADVDMEAACSRLMGTVAHADGLLQNGGAYVSRGTPGSWDG